MKISNIHKNRMGTISFEAICPRWRQPQEFIVYPMQSGETAEVIRIQSQKRWADISVKTGNVAMTNGKGGHPNSWLLAMQMGMGTAEAHKVSEDDMQALKEAIFATAGSKVGNNGMHVYSDNSAAVNIMEV
jgi:hypothetical protein